MGLLLGKKYTTAPTTTTIAAATSTAHYYSLTRFSTTTTTAAATSTVSPEAKIITSDCKNQQQRQKIISEIDVTKKWFETVVIGEKLCPFAPPFLKDPNLLRIVSFDEERVMGSNSDSDDGQLPKTSPRSSRSVIKCQMIDFIRQQVDELVGEEPLHNHETTLVILDVPLLREFRDFVRFSWDVQEQVIHENEKYDGKLQIVLFHPKATHQTYGETPGDGIEENASDYTIRSPYPTIHLLRESDVLKAVQSNYPNLDTLPMRNQNKFQQQGADVCKKRLDNCFHSLFDTK